MPSPLRLRILFTRPKAWHVFSSLIRLLTRSEVSHVVILYHDYDFELEMVLEATGSGFRIVPLNAFAQANHIVRTVEPKANLASGLTAAAKWLGGRYDFEGVLGMLLVLLGRWMKLKWRNPFRSRRALFCSEVTVRILQAAKYPGAEKLDPESTSPQDLLEFLDG